ncbi:MAG: DUF899 family protein [Deltaproteobacteria bacterium]|nr:DUF899 family protein [Deltaproteobacteria bacterium]
MEQRPYPNETSEYRQARDQLLDAEEALRAQVEQVAALRHELPLGGGVREDYVFEEMDDGGNVQQVRLSELFDEGRESLLVYGFMFGPKMEKACPMCTSFLDSLDGAAPHIGQNMNLAVSARSPIGRISEFAKSRGWKNLRLLSSADNSFQYDYLAEGKEEDQWPMANIFVRRDGKVHHYWGSELMFRPYAGGNSRHIDVLWPLWNVLDLSPEGRGEDWYPALSYES